MKDCTANQMTTPDATSMPNVSSARAAMRSARSMSSASSAMIAAAPAKPSSFPATAKMKSVCCSGMKFPEIRLPWNSPWPNTPPDPMATFACAALYPLPCGSASGWRNAVSRPSW